MKDKKILNIGIDLGTSRSVIVCDNGIRQAIPSFIGYPKDAVSLKLLGEMVYGEDAIRHRLSVKLYRPFDKGVLLQVNSDKKGEAHLKSTAIARALLRKLVAYAFEEEEDDKLLLRGVIGAPALATQNNKKDFLEIADGVLDDVMIASEPFCVAYGMNALNSALIVDIGAGTTDLCRMHGTIPGPDDQITTFKAGDYVDQVFLELIENKYKEANFTVNMIKRFKEENASISEHGEQLFIELPIKGKPTSCDVTNELREACHAIVPDIVEGIRKLVATFDPEFQDGLKQNVILAGGGSRMIGLHKEIESYMKKTLGYGKVTRVEDSLYAGANGALMLCKDMPDEYWDELKKRK